MNQLYFSSKTIFRGSQKWKNFIAEIMSMRVCYMCTSLTFQWDHISLNLATLAKKNGPTPASFCLFSFLSNTDFTEKTVGVSRIRTRIVVVEGKHTDNVTTTLLMQNFSNVQCFYGPILNWAKL